LHKRKTRAENWAILSRGSNFITGQAVPESRPKFLQGKIKHGLAYNNAKVQMIIKNNRSRFHGVMNREPELRI
jgi:hypothetical protein